MPCLPACLAVWLCRQSLRLFPPVVVVPKVAEETTAITDQVVRGAQARHRHGTA